MNEHTCIKCKKVYESEDEDDYLCVTCLEQKKIIAEEVDKKMAGNVSKRGQSDLKVYDEIRKAKGVRFVNIRDLGIDLNSL